VIWRALSALALEFGVRVSWRDLSAQATQMPKDLEPEVAAVHLQSYGIQARTYQVNHVKDILTFPCLLQLKENNWALLTSISADKANVQLFTETVSDEQTQFAQSQWCALETLQTEMTGLVLAAVYTGSHHSSDSEWAVKNSDWFWGVFGRLRAHYGDCVIAAILINLLTLAGSMFSMNVYDRVVPNAALNSLWALAIGVTLAGLLEFGLRSLRAHVLDEAGKRVDLVLSAAIFKKTMQLKAEQRPNSSGQWSGQIREFESVRDFVSSSTLVVLTDLPFCFLFLAVIFWMGGSLVWIPLVAGILTMLFGALTQIPIRRSVERYQFENTQKHAMLIESMERLETIEALGAQSGVQSRWERVCAATARSAMASRLASSLTVNMSQWLQQLASTSLIVLGVYLILMGQLTVGALIGCSILASRALAPLAQVAGLMARWHNTKMSFSAVDKVMALPVNDSHGKTFVSIDRFKNHLELDGIEFSFPRSDRTVLQIPRLQFQKNEITAVMGPVGSGKSSLLRLLAGLITPTHGRLMVDGLELKQLSPADWRAQVSWVSQDVVLFKGSLRENLLIASPKVRDERFLHVLRICGLESLIKEHPHGLDMQLGESGMALSGGQRQLVALARALLSDTPILLLDEPTSAMDMPGEQQLLLRLRTEFQGKLVVMATHRPGPLELASRLIILDQGRIVADGARDDVMQAVKEGRVQRPRPTLKTVGEVAA